MTVGNEPVPGNGATVDAQSYASAILNILEDAAAEKAHLEATQKAILNVLADAADERTLLADTQRAVLNILDDAAMERIRLEATQKAVLNVLDDSADEKARLVETQRAALNILDDFDVEKKKVEQINLDLRNEVEERVHAEEALRVANATAEAANRELEAFSYSVAHDLRAPLRAMDGFSHALIDDYGDKLDGTAHDYLGRVRAAAQRMARLIDDILALSRISRREMQRRTVNLSDIVVAIGGRLKEADPQRDVSFHVEPGLVADADEGLARVVLENLVGNAWKFTGRTPAATIKFGVTDHEGEPAFFVSDNGVGFDMAYADKLFQPFQRLHSDKEYEGTGIGLATVARVVHRHGGRIWANSEPGRGTVIHFTL